MEARGEPSDLGNAEVGDRISAQRAVDLGLADTDNDDPRLRRPVRELPGRGGRRPAPACARSSSAASACSASSCTPWPTPPAIAYVLFVLGMALLLFELFTAGVGVAGLVGAGALILGCYGLAVLPTDHSG